MALAGNDQSEPCLQTILVSQYFLRRKTPLHILGLHTSERFPCLS
jgi:hypothetical protein